MWLWEGCYASDAINDIQPCRYSYGVGAVGMVLAMIAITCQVRPQKSSGIHPSNII